MAKSLSSSSLSSSSIIFRTSIIFNIIILLIMILPKGTLAFRTLFLLKNPATTTMTRISTNTLLQCNQRGGQRPCHYSSSIRMSSGIVDGSDADKKKNSVTGTVYLAGEEESSSSVVVKLFTKEGCTLCDKVKDVLKELRDETPHDLVQIDITDDCHKDWYDKYKYDIPVLHMNDLFWIKHRLTADEARNGFRDASNGSFVEAKPGEPNASAMER